MEYGHIFGEFALVGFWFEVIDTFTELVVVSEFVEEGAEVIGELKVLGEPHLIGGKEVSGFIVEGDAALDGEVVGFQAENFFQAPLGDWGEGKVVAPNLVMGMIGQGV